MDRRRSSKYNKGNEKLDKSSRETYDIRKPLSPDRELLIWEKWIQIRKEETTKLGEKLHRKPVDLTMNLLENLREDIERKTALTMAQVEKKPTVRGTLFEPPLRLKQRCYCQPVYEVHRTPAELGRPRKIEHIGVPKEIQKTELGLSGDTQRPTCHQLNADYVKYREKREMELAKNIRKIDPFRPSTSNLIVQGFKPKTPPPKYPTPPLISVDAPRFFSDEAVSEVYALKINNTVFYRVNQENISTHLSMLQVKRDAENCSSWSYYFNVPVQRPGRSKLFLHNLGTVTLRYCWKIIKKSLPFIPASSYEQVFYFNKNEDVLSPGQCRDICFTFVSDKPGIYNEIWELLITNVCFFDTASEKLIVNLYADSVENIDNIKRNVENLKTAIHQIAISNLVNEILIEILDKVFVIVPQTYPYKHYFLEAEIFVMKNPVCFYHQTEVEKMKELYRKDMSSGQTWDLSIVNWRAKMLTKDFDNRMNFYDALKKSHSVCLKPWYEGGELLQEKYKAINELLGQLADNFDSEYERLTNIYGEQPQVEHPSDNNQISIIDPITQQVVHNIFFLHAYDHVATAIELCSGILSSLDANRWIEFDFCRS